MGHLHLRDPRQVRTERDVQPDRDRFEAVNGWIDTGSRDFDSDGSTRRRTLGPRGGTSRSRVRPAGGSSAGVRGERGHDNRSKRLDVLRLTRSVIATVGATDVRGVQWPLRAERNAWKETSCRSKTSRGTLLWRGG